jgi:hypothetical protein
LADVSLELSEVFVDCFGHEVWTAIPIMLEPSQMRQRAHFAVVRNR